MGVWRSYWRRHRCWRGLARKTRHLVPFDQHAYHRHRGHRVPLAVACGDLWDQERERRCRQVERRRRCYPDIQSERGRERVDCLSAKSLCTIRAQRWSTGRKGQKPFVQKHAGRLGRGGVPGRERHVQHGKRGQGADRDAWGWRVGRGGVIVSCSFPAHVYVCSPAGFDAPLESTQR